jgi:Fe-Mn family superoxide dismutase
MLMISSRALLLLAACVCFNIATFHTTFATAQNLPLPDLPYAYDALEPAIDETTMRVHHLMHHAGYTRKVNAALATLRSDPETKKLAKMGIDTLLNHLDEVPETLRATVRNNGGGYVNHCMFFKGMKAPAAVAAVHEKEGDADAGASDVADNAPVANSPLSVAIDAHFGSFAAFQQQFSDLAGGVFGSGWAFLYYDTSDEGALKVTKTANQDTPAMNGHAPILALDVWEHA